MYFGMGAGVSARREPASEFVLGVFLSESVSSLLLDEGVVVVSLASWLSSIICNSYNEKRHGRYLLKLYKTKSSSAHFKDFKD